MTTGSLGTSRQCSSIITGSRKARKHPGTTCEPHCCLVGPGRLLSRLKTSTSGASMCWKHLASPRGECSSLGLLHKGHRALLQEPALHSWRDPQDLKGLVKTRPFPKLCRVAGQRHRQTIGARTLTSTHTPGQPSPACERGHGPRLKMTQTPGNQGFPSDIRILVLVTNFHHPAFLRSCRAFAHRPCLWKGSTLSAEQKLMVCPSTSGRGSGKGTAWSRRRHSAAERTVFCGP